MGAKPRPKGNRFERKIAKILIDTFEGVEAWRTQQSDEAYNSDVVATGNWLVETIWWECEDALEPGPDAKLRQATRDVERYLERTGDQRIPIAVTHKSRAKFIWVTMWNRDWMTICNLGVPPERAPTTQITVRWDRFLTVLQEVISARPKRP